MKKQLLLGAFLLGTLLTAKAQTTVWSDNFDDEDISNWTLIDSDGDEFNWSVAQLVDNGGQPVGTPVLRSMSWTSDPPPDGTGLNPDNWAISPVINLSTYTAGTLIQLNWKAMAADADFDTEKYTVYVGTSNTTEALMASTVTFSETLSGINDLTPRTIDISSFAGEATVYVAYRHHGVFNQFSLEMDDVTVVAGGTAGLNENLASKFSVFPNPANNVINISNAENILVDGVEIVDLNGRTVKSVKYDGVATAEINISELSSGLYMMNVSSDKGMTTKKIMKN